MEVHAHTHTERKKWTHYLWEFLMLFLAVFCGFLAEYQLEHKIEKDREKQYVQSFYEDLSADENSLSNTIKNLDRLVQIADSLALLMPNGSTTQPANHIYMYLREITRSGRVFIYINDRTIVQLRNAGGMRLIRNKEVSDSMVAYYKETDFLQFLFDESLTMKRSLREKFSNLLHAKDFSKIINDDNEIIDVNETLHLRSADPNIINNCLLEINNIRGLSMGTKKRIQQLKNWASRLKHFIENKYHLK